MSSEPDSGSQQFDWKPDWAAPVQRPAASHGSDTHALELMDLRNKRVNGDQISVAVPVDDEPEPIQVPGPEDEMTLKPDLNRAVKRALGGIHIFMITISGVLGIGLYIQGGTILRLGGPVAVILSFFLLGIVAWGVMHCVAEMLCIWPITGALHVYVEEFVDQDLGITVGVAYWFTNTVAFAALITATIRLTDYWGLQTGWRVGLVFLIPVVLVGINAFGVRIYGLIEVFGGTLKLTFFVIIMALMIAINLGFGSGTALGTSLLPSPLIVRDSDATIHWAQAFLMSLSMAAFAFVGVEIPAATALEARFSGRNTPNTPPTVGRAVKLSIVSIPVIATLMYLLAGLLVIINIRWDDPRLPRLNWEPNTTNTPVGSRGSGFVLVAAASQVPGLDHALNAFLIFTALTCANTNLYIASRTLFSLTRDLDGSGWVTGFLAYFGRTSGHMVPLRALLASCLFAWVPFLYLIRRREIGVLLNVFTQIGSVGVVTVWACECLAYIRFRDCLCAHRLALADVPLVRRWQSGANIAEEQRYPYKGHGQPAIAYISFVACLFLLIVANGAGLWKRFHYETFLASYLALLLFIGLYGVLKVCRGGRFRFIDLTNAANVRDKLQRLDEIRDGSAQYASNVKPRLQNLWGRL